MCHAQGADTWLHCLDSSHVPEWNMGGDSFGEAYHHRHQHEHEHEHKHVAYIYVEMDAYNGIMIDRLCSYGIG